MIPSSSIRICSLLPSATEIVYALGIGDRLVAVTHECDYPIDASRLPVITGSNIDHTGNPSREIHNHIVEAMHSGSGLYYIDHALLKRLAPGIIITQELCGVCAVSYDEVQRSVRHLPGEQNIISLEPRDVGDILVTIKEVGELAGVGDYADGIIRILRDRISAVDAGSSSVVHRPRVLALEWLDPAFVGGHWVPEMIHIAGGYDGIGRYREPSIEVSWEDIRQYDPEIIILMPCGYHLDDTVRAFRQTERDPEWNLLSAVRNDRVYAVDGSSYFNRPGPRIVDGVEILAEILQPQRFPRKKSNDCWRHILLGT
jgi:iron complex transport system substrate-binding protein